MKLALLSTALLLCTPSLAQSCLPVRAVGGPSPRLVSFDGSVTANAFPAPQKTVEGLGTIALGTLGTGDQFRAMSRDGAILVGSSRSAADANEVRACRWLPDGSAQSLGTLGGSLSFASDCSEDGSTVVGVSLNAAGQIRAFRWSAVSGMAALGTLGGDTSWATSVSGDGTVIAGYAQAVAGSAGDEVFRWTASTGVQSLGAPAGTALADATVSFDGTSIICEGEDHSVWHWTAATGFQQIQPAQALDVVVTGISDDGATVVGKTPGVQPTTFAWTLSQGALTLPANGLTPTIEGLSADGSLAIGYLEDLSSFARQGAVWDLASPAITVETIDPSGQAGAFLDFISGDGSLVFGSDSQRFTYALDGGVGDPFCGAATANSTGCPSRMAAHGDRIAPGGSLRLSVSSLPANATAFFLASRVQGMTFPVTGSQGVLCLSGAIGRFVGPGQIQDSGVDGLISLEVDLTAMPTPTGPVPVAAGETWNFQAWHRDVNPMATSNFSDAVSVTLR